MKDKIILWYGVASIIPLAYFFIIIALMPSLINDAILGGLDSGSFEASQEFSILFMERYMGLMLVYYVFLVALLILYIRDLYRNKNVPKSRQTAWVFVMIFAGVVGLPIYWYLNIYAPSKAEEQFAAIH